MHRQLFEHHPTVGYRFIPEIKARNLHESGGYLIQTNNIGFRDHKKLNTHYTGQRIFWFGDSFTAGDGVSNGKRFTDILDAKHREIDVFNFGLSGSGTDQQYLIYRNLLSSYPCDLIVVTVLVENIRRVNSHYRFFLNSDNEMICYQKPYFRLNDTGDLVLLNVPVDKKQYKPDELPTEERKFIDKGGRFYQVRKLLQHEKVKTLAQKISRFQPVPEYNSSATSEWQLMRAILRKWAEEAHCPFLVVPLPLYQHLEETSSSAAYQKRFAELAVLPNMNIYDPLPELKKYPIEERRKFRFKKDIHLTPYGHSAIADILAKPVCSILQNQ